MLTTLSDVFGCWLYELDFSPVICPVLNAVSYLWRKSRTIYFSFSEREETFTQAMRYEPTDTLVVISGFKLRRQRFY